MLSKTPHRSTNETLVLTPAEVDQWRIPPFQRPLRVNAKVLAMSEELKINGGIISGVITLGKVLGQKTLYIVDGQHRIEGFRISEMPEAIADVRTIVFQSLAEMAEEFVRLNTALVKLNPDDILRGLEGTHEPLHFIHSQFNFVGYDNVRRGGTAIVSMSVLLRSWNAASKETPSTGSIGAATLAAELEMDNAKQLVSFLGMAESAWSRDPEYYRLWGTLNMSICMWLYRKAVIAKPDLKKRSTTLTPDRFRKCLIALTADHAYLDWLVGRNLSDRDRSPCYARIRRIFVKRLSEDGIEKPKLLQPVWFSA